VALPAFKPWSWVFCEPEARRPAPEHCVEWPQLHQRYWYWGPY